MGTPTSAFEAAVATKLRSLAGPTKMKQWTQRGDNTVTEEVEAVTDFLVEGTAQEVADKLGDLEYTDLRAVDLTVRLTMARFTGEVSQSYTPEQQAAERRVLDAIESERMRRIANIEGPERLVDEAREVVDLSDRFPTNTRDDD